MGAVAKKKNTEQPARTVRSSEEPDFKQQLNK